MYLSVVLLLLPFCLTILALTLMPYRPTTTTHVRRRRVCLRAQHACQHTYLPQHLVMADGVWVAWWTTCRSTATYNATREHVSYCTSLPAMLPSGAASRPAAACRYAFYRGARVTYSLPPGHLPPCHTACRTYLLHDYIPCRLTATFCKLPHSATTVERRRPDTLRRLPYLPPRCPSAFACSIRVMKLLLLL